VARSSSWFIWSALAYFTIGIGLGLSMAIWPAQVLNLRAAHAHINLLGWVSMFIFGVAYHVLPRFTGHPLHSPRLAEVHVGLANLGLLVMAGGFAGLGTGPIVAAGGVVEAIGGLCFVYNIARTLTSRPAPVAAPISMGIPPRR
jgi:cbb3-type cytochrome oxidase subunit 1